MDNNYNNNNNYNNDDNFYQQPKENYQNPYDNYDNGNYNNNYNNNGNNEPPEGTTAFVLGILSIVLCCSFPTPIALSIIAIIYANKCRTIMGGVDTSKSSTGRTCAIIGLVLSALIAIAYLAYYLLIIVASVASV